MDTLCIYTYDLQDREILKGFDFLNHLLCAEDWLLCKAHNFDKNFQVVFHFQIKLKNKKNIY